MSGPELPARAPGHSPGVRVSVLGAVGGGQGLGVSPAQSTGELVCPSPGGQGSCIRDSAQLGGFEPGWATTIRKTAQIMSREIETPGSLMTFPSKEEQSVYMQNTADFHGRRVFWAPGAGKSMGFGGRGPGFKSQLGHLVAVWPQASY